MASTTVSQVWQTIEQLSWREQFQLMQLLLQNWQQRWGETAQNKPVSQIKSPRGKYTFVPTSSDAFAKRKQDEIALER